MTMTSNIAMEIASVAARTACNKETTGGENIARKSGPRNGPSKTGRPSGKGRGNNPSKK